MSNVKNNGINRGMSSKKKSIEIMDRKVEWKKNKISQPLPLTNLSSKMHKGIEKKKV